MRVDERIGYRNVQLALLPALLLSACGSAFQTNGTSKPSHALAQKSRNSHVGEKAVAGSADGLAKPASPSSTTLQMGGDEQNLGGLQPINSRQMLDHVQTRYDKAREHWTTGELTLAREELDLGFRMLMLVPSALDEAQEKRRDELQLLLSRLVVTMGATQAGTIGEQSEIPLVINEYVEREIRSFQTGERHFFVEAYRRSGYYRDRIVKALEEQHMPTELAWLPLIESGFNVRALSPARALGMWQFIPTTGYRFGLSRDIWIDERMDPERSTQAAISYLKQLHGLFGDWSTALAGYNCGENLVAGVIRRQKVEYLDSFWDLFPKLPYETARYVPRFMATLLIVKDPAKYGFTELELATPRTYETVTVVKQASLKDLARLLEIDPSDLAVLNPELRQGVTPPTGYMVKVPESLAAVLTAKLTQVPETNLIAQRDNSRKGDETPQEANSQTATAKTTAYKVRNGDTLSAIARRFRVSVPSLIRANSLSSGHRLTIGQLLKIPRRGV